METNRARDAKGRFLVAVIALWAGGCSHVATGSASADASVPISPWPNVSLPFAEHVLDMNDAPVIVVDTHGITLDGEAAGDVGPIIATSRMQRIDLLFESLKRKRDAWRVAHPDQIFSGECNLVIDASVRAVVVKSVFQTAAFAGYPNASFVVRRLPPESSSTLGRLPVDAQVPGPPQASTQGSGRLAPAVIQRVVRQNFGSFRKCYEQALARDPRAAGRVAVHFVIERSGQVSHAEVAPSLDADAPPLNDARAVACIVDGFSKLVFPRPEEGIVTVVYPVNFSPGD